MVLTDEERKAKRKAIRRKSYEKNIEKIKTYAKEYYSRPEVKASHTTPEARSKARENNQKYRTSNPEKIKKYKAEYKKNDDMNTKDKARRQTPEYKAKDKARRQTPEYKAKKKEYSLRPEVKVMKKEYRKRDSAIKLEVFSTYSKRHSDNEIPCCRCCGENFNIIFLTIDHIEGREHLSKTEKDQSGGQLYRWLKRNNYPEGYQVLCWNCNSAKGLLGECPHEMK